MQERVEDNLYAGFTSTERDQLRDLLHRIEGNAIRLTGSTGARAGHRAAQRLGG